MGADKRARRGSGTGRAQGGRRERGRAGATLACGPGGMGARGGHGVGRWAERNRPRTGLARGEEKKMTGPAGERVWRGLGRSGVREEVGLVAKWFGFWFPFLFTISFPLF